MSSSGGGPNIIESDQDELKQVLWKKKVKKKYGKKKLKCFPWAWTCTFKGSSKLQYNQNVKSRLYNKTSMEHTTQYFNGTTNNYKTRKTIKEEKKREYSWIFSMRLSEHTYQSWEFWFWLSFCFRTFWNVNQSELMNFASYESCQRLASERWTL